MWYMFRLVQQDRRGRLHIEAEGVARTPAPIVWALVSDANSYPDWGPWSAAGYHRAGDPDRGGAGAIRWFRYGRTTTVEEVEAADACKRLVYTVIGGIPVRNYRAEVTLTQVPEGTQVRWSANWDRTMGGRLVYRSLRTLYPRMMAALVAAAERSVPADHQPRGEG